MIGVVVVLMALLFPVFKKANAKAKDAKCVANLRMWGGAILAYAAENGGVYRNWFSGTRNHANAAQYWPYYMIYVSDYSVAQLQRARCPIGPNNSSETVGVHYGFYAADKNGRIVDNPGGKHYEIRVAIHPSPTMAILLADSLTSSGEQFHTIFPDVSISRGGIHSRHGGRANLFFLDGHVESANPERLGVLGVVEYYDEKGVKKATPIVK